MSHVSLVANNADIATTRDDLASWLANNAPQLSSRKSGDIVLAASELLSNGIEHGEGGCLLDMRRIQDQLILTVTNSVTNADILPAEWWQMPDATERAGRGLAIVRAVADAVELRTTPTSVSVSAAFDLHNPQPTRPLVAAAAI